MAEIKDILETNDFSVHIQVGYSLPNTLTESVIDQALLDTGNPNPKIQDVSFFMSDNVKVFAISWFQDTSLYGYLKMKIAN